MKSLYFDEFRLEVYENDTLKVTYEALSEIGDVDDRESYESKSVPLHLQPGDDLEIAVAIDELKKGKLKGQRLELLGDRLYRILFPDEIHKRFEQALRNIARHPNERGLRIIIAYPDDSRVARWPLEVLHCPSPDVWLATDMRLSMSRKITGGRYIPREKNPPLKILVVVSSPKRKAGVMSTKLLESLVEWAELTHKKSSKEERGSRPRYLETLAEEEIGDSTPIEVQVLGQIEGFEPKDKNASTVYLDCPAGYQEFVEKVKTWKPQVLHFIGHGDVRGDQGRLAFVNPLTGLAEWVTAKQFSQLIIPGSLLQLVVLQVCKSADADVQLSLALSMVDLDIPAVVAMQFEIDNYCAVEFASHFYQTLAQRKAVDYAVQLARFHITQVPDPDTKRPLFWSNREFCTPVVYTYKPVTIIETSSAKFQQVPGGALTSWPGQQVSAEETLSQYLADLEHYKTIGDQDIVDLMQKRVDNLLKARQVGTSVGLPGGPQTVLPAVLKSSRKGWIKK
jgi:hypothetical protein